MQHVKLLFMWSVGGTTLLLTNQVKDGVMRVTIMGREGVNCPCSGHKSCDTKSDIHLQNKGEILELVQVHFNL